MYGAFTSVAIVGNGRQIGHVFLRQAAHLGALYDDVFVVGRRLAALRIGGAVGQTADRFARQLADHCDV